VLIPEALADEEPASDVHRSVADAVAAIERGA
jgi:hypothetical protein